jgi:DNA adenine methylase
MPREFAEPFLRWAGSKRKQLALLSGFWSPNFKRYVEPFMGSACLCFALQPRKAVLGDINLDLVNTFIAVRDHPRAVANRLAKLPLGERSYYSIRKVKSRDLTANDAAARFIYLNRFCFNGLYRTNRCGQFNVPYGGSGTGRLPDASQLRQIAKYLSVCTISHKDFSKTLATTRAGDFVYLDPPYAVGNRRVFRQYDPSSFGLQDLKRLASHLRTMDKKGVKFVLSYAACAEANRYFKRWRQRKIYIQRNIAGFATQRRRACEILISNCSLEDPADTRRKKTCV